MFDQRGNFVDGLKRSLEEAIKEMQDTPAVDKTASPQAGKGGMTPASPSPPGTVPDEGGVLATARPSAQTSASLSLDLPLFSSGDSERETAVPPASPFVAAPEPDPVPLPSFAQDLNLETETGSDQGDEPAPDPDEVPMPSFVRGTDIEADLQAELAGKRRGSSSRSVAPDTGATRRDPALPPVAVVHSIEEALATAPSVSPKYVAPPPPPPPVPEPEMPSIEVPPLSSQMPSQMPPPRREETRARAPVPPVKGPSRGPDVAKAASAAPVPLARGSARQTASPPVMSPPVSAPGAKKVVNKETESDVSPVGKLVKAGRDVAERATDTATEQGQKARDNFWRWTTIGLSCAGGLASGWLGSTLSDQGAGVFRSDVQTIAGKASEGKGSAPPVNLKLASTGNEAGKTSLEGTGKTDRAVPLDENLCTVLELDRATGLTLAKPCKPIESTEFSSTLRKDDLLVKPR